MLERKAFATGKFAASELRAKRERPPPTPSFVRRGLYLSTHFLYATHIYSCHKYFSPVFI
jgi:hypothetical protein